MNLLRQITLLLLCLVFTNCSVTDFSSQPNQLGIEVKNAPRVFMDPETKKMSEAMHHYLVGQLSYDLENFDGALKNFTKSSELVEEPAPALHARLAELYLRESDLEGGLREIEKALKVAPDDRSYQLMYAGILETVGRAAEAEPIYLKLIKQEPEQIDPYLLLSNLYLGQAEFPKAIQILESLRDQIPGELAPYYYLGRVYEASGDLVKGERFMAEAYKRRGGNPNIAAEYIRVLLKARKVDRVKSICEELLVENPENLVARRVLGEMAIGEGNFDSALKHLQVLQAVEENPAEARYKIALIQIERQNFKEAERELLLVLASTPENSRARYYLASIYAGGGRTKEAVEELLRVESGQEMFVKSRTFAAFLLRQDKDFVRAEQAVREALEVAPDDGKILSYLILILRDSKQYGEARVLLERIIADDPENDRLLFNYAIVLNDLGETERSLQAMERVIQVNPEHADALNFVAYSIAEDGGDYVRAETLVQQALSIRPNDGYFLDTLGWIYYKQSRYEEAKELLSRAVGLTGQDIVILEHFADVLSKTGDPENAMKYFGQALKVGSITEEKSQEEQQALERVRDKLQELSRQYPDVPVDIPSK